MYNRNRLIKAYLKVGIQLQGSGIVFESIFLMDKGKKSMELSKRIFSNQLIINKILILLRHIVRAYLSLQKVFRNIEIFLIK